MLGVKGDGCLDGEAVAAFVAGELDAASVDVVDCHLDTCEACVELVVRAAALHDPASSVTLHGAGVSALASPAGAGAAGEASGAAKSNGLRATELRAAPVSDGGNARFELGELIARGAMGAVYHGVDRQTGQRVAIKRLRPELASEKPELVLRFVLEGEILSRLNHPNIVKMLAAQPDGDDRVIVMEYVAGGSLRSLLRREPQLPLQRVLTILLELTDALSRAHHLRIIHRDLKPENVLLAEDGTPRLSDFGLAHAPDQGLTEKGEVMGTIAYLSPEALWGRELDERADIWALGVMTYEMLAGQNPFWNDSAGATVTAILQKPLTDLEALRPDVPVALVDLVYRMLDKDREQRIPSTRRVGAELEAILRELGSTSGPRRLSLPVSSRGAGAASDRLPAQPTPFIGRDDELAELMALLAEPSVRLVTILGSGGMGKSRLAIEAARLLSEAAKNATPSDLAASRVIFVELAPLAAADLIAPALADAVGYRFYPGVDPWSQLLDYFREKRLLVLMDNFENVVDGAHLVSELLAAAPGVQVLATSRERLGVSAEVQFNLGGMNVPELEETARAASASAVELFVSSARRVVRGFELSEADVPDVLAICKLVQGMPLGIVLAASWLGMLSPADIRQEIERGLDFLRTDLCDVPPRQQSLRAVFDHSCRLLSSEARSVFLAVSIFRGGVTRAAAEAVAGASLRSLAELLNKSLLSRDPQSGRYEIHELLRQYAEGLLSRDPAAHERVTACHAEYFTRFAGERHAALHSSKQRRALREMDADWDNVRAAWSHVLARRNTALVGLAIEPLGVYYQRRSVAEGRSAFRAVVEAFGPEPRDEQLEERRVVGLALALQGLFCAEQGLHAEGHTLLSRALLVLDETEHTGDLAFALVTAAFSLRGVDSIERTMSHAERGLALYRRSDDRLGLARALIFAARVSLHVFGDSAKAEAQYREAVAIQKAYGDGSVVLPLSLAGLGQALMLQGEQAEGIVLIREGLSIAESFEDPWSMLSCLNAMALTERSLGNYAAAEAAARRSLALCSQFGCERASTWGCLMLADALKEQGRLDEAEANYRTALARGASDAVIQASARVDLGNIALGRGELAAARELLSTSLAGFEAIRNRWGTVIALDGMATLHCRENDPAAAEQLLRRGLDLALAARGKWLALNVIAGLALVRARQGHAVRAVELLGRVQTHPSTEHSTRTRRIAPLLEELRSRLPAAEFDAALARGAEIALSAAFD